MKRRKFLQGLAATALLPSVSAVANDALLAQQSVDDNVLALAKHVIGVEILTAKYVEILGARIKSEIGAAHLAALQRKKLIDTYQEVPENMKNMFLQRVNQPALNRLIEISFSSYYLTKEGSFEIGIENAPYPLSLM